VRCPQRSPFWSEPSHVRHYPLGTADPASQLRRTPIFRNLPLCSGGLRPPDRRSEINATKESCSGAVPSSESGVRRGERLYNKRQSRRFIWFGAPEYSASFEKVLFRNTKRETSILRLNRKRFLDSFDPFGLAQGRTIARNDRNSVGMTKKNCSGGVRA